LEKTIYIDDKPVRLKSTAAISKRYKAQFRRDYFGDLLKLAKVFAGAKDAGEQGTKEQNEDEQGGDTLASVGYDDLNHLDFEVLYDIIWTMAKTADKNIPDPMEWLDTFDAFPIMEIMPEVQDMIESSMTQTKKK